LERLFGEIEPKELRGLYLPYHRKKSTLPAIWLYFRTEKFFLNPLENWLAILTKPLKKRKNSRDNNETRIDFGYSILSMGPFSYFAKILPVCTIVLLLRN